MEGIDAGSFPSTPSAGKSLRCVCQPGDPSERQAGVAPQQTQKRTARELALAVVAGYRGESSLFWGDGFAIALGLERARARQAMMLVKLMELQLKI